MKLLRPLAGYTVYDHKTNDYIAANYGLRAYYTRQMNTDGTGFHAYKECHKAESPLIILLQTTRKENNWKTEEALARTPVTVEAERIKESNP